MRGWIIIIIISLIAGGVFLYNSLYRSDSGLARLNTLKTEYRSLIEENQKLREENQRLRLQIELLKGDDRYIEKVARERNMIKDGDVVFRIKQ